MSVNLASAYMTIIPSMQGFQGTIARQLSGEGASAGQAVGSRFSGGFKSVVGAGVIAGAVGGLAGAAAGAVGGALSRGFAGAKDAIIGFNSTLQQSSIGFTTMLGSATKAQSFVQNLQSFAAKTPFEFQGLVQNSNTMLGMGIAAKDVIPDLTALGDSVASVGGDGTVLNNTISAFSQTMAKGTLDMGNMNQLLQGGVPNALKILASSYHVTTGEMVKMISAGKVQSADALPRLIKGIEAGTSSTAALGGMMDKQSVTMQGALSNISDASTQLLAKAFKPLFTQASLGANALAKILGSPQMTVWAGKIAAGTTVAIGAFTRLRTGVTGFFTSFSGGGQLTPILGFFSQMGAALAPLVPALIQAVTAFSPLRIAFQALAPVLPVVTLALTQLGAALGQGLAAAVAAIAPAVVTLTNGLVAFLVPLLKTPALVQTVAVGFLAWKVATAGFAFASLITGLIQTTVQLGLNAAAWVRNAAAQVASKAQTIAIMALYAGEFIANLVRSGVALGVQAVQWIASTAAMVAARVAMVAGAIATGIATAAQWALNAALTANPIGIVVVAVAALVAALIWFFTQTKLGQQIWAGFVAVLQAAWRAIVAGVQVLVAGFAHGWAQITAGVRAAWAFIVGAVTANVNRVRAVVSAVVNAIAALWRAQWTGIQTVIRTVWNVIVSVVTTVINRVRAVVSAGINLVRSVISAGMNAALGVIRNVWNSIVSTITGAVGRAVGIVRGMGTQILSAIGGIVGRMVSAGRSIVEGLARGISGAVGSAINAVKGVISAVTNFLPHSPAKEGPLSGKGWTLYSGHAITESLAEGMTARTGLLRSAAGDVMSAAHPTLGTYRTPAVAMASTAGLGVAGAGFPGTVTLVDKNGSLLGHMDARIDRYDMSQQLAGAR